MAALHSSQYAVRPALHRQVQMRDQFRYLSVSLYQVLVKFNRVRSRESNSVYAFDRSDVIDQQGQINDLTLMRQSLVGVDILSQQVDFPDTLLCQVNCSASTSSRSADFFSSGIRDNTKLRTCCSLP